MWLNVVFSHLRSDFRTVMSRNALLYLSNGVFLNHFPLSSNRESNEENFLLLVVLTGLKDRLKKVRSSDVQNP